LPDYVAEVQALKAAYPGYVLLGIEADYRPGTVTEVQGLLENYPFDYVIGSVHFLEDWGFDDPRHIDEYRGRDVDSLWAQYLELVGDAAESGLFTILGHLDLIKKFGFMGANTARRFDPQIAAIYYDQMVKKGKHHTQAVCACATHLLDRILVILREDRPYELRDIDGTPITPEQAKAIIAERYQVPEEVRQRNSKRARRERTDQQLERRQPKQKGSRPRR
jgi:hypothetical protein